MTAARENLAGFIIVALLQITLSVCLLNTFHTDFFALAVLVGQSFTALKYCRTGFDSDKK